MFEAIFFIFIGFIVLSNIRNTVSKKSLKKYMTPNESDTTYRESERPYEAGYDDQYHQAQRETYTPPTIKVGQRRASQSSRSGQNYPDWKEALSKANQKRSQAHIGKSSYISTAKDQNRSRSSNWGKKNREIINGKSIAVALGFFIIAFLVAQS